MSHKYIDVAPVYNHYSNHQYIGTELYINTTLDTSDTEQSYFKVNLICIVADWN